MFVENKKVRFFLFDLVFKMFAQNENISTSIDLNVPLNIKESSKKATVKLHPKTSAHQ